MTQYHVRSTDQTAESIVTSDFGGQFPLAVRAAIAIAPYVQQQLQVVEDRARAHNLSVYHSFNAPLFTGVRTFSGPQYDWHLLPLAEDPAYTHKAGFPLPREVLAQLRRIEAANLPLDTVYIAHETPKAAGYLPGPVDHRSLLMPPISTKAQQKASSMGELAASLVKAAFAPALLAGVVGAAALAAPLAAGALVGLDPILWGIICDPREGLRPGAMASWVYLCHWSYE